MEATQNPLTFDSQGNLLIPGVTVQTSDAGNRVVIQEATRGGQSVGEVVFYTEVAGDTPGKITALGPVDGGTRALELTAPAAAGVVDVPQIDLTYNPETFGSRITLDASETLVDVLTVTELVAANLQSGIVSVTTTAGMWVTTPVVFPTAFANTPVVVATSQSSAPTGTTTDLKWAVSGVSTAGFTLSVFRTTALTFNFGWIALA